MNIPDRILEDAFWELENDIREEVFIECKEIAKTQEEARQLYIRVRAMHFMHLEKKQKINDAKELVKTEEIWDKMKKDNGV